MTQMGWMRRKQLPSSVKGRQLEPVEAPGWRSAMTQRSPFRHFKTSPETIRLAVMLDVRYSLPLRDVEDLLHERGIDIFHETVRFWWHRFGPMLAAEIPKALRGRDTISPPTVASESGPRGDQHRAALPPACSRQ